MLEDFFITINTWMSGEFGIALIACFLWGIVSILFSPCHMASIPLMISYLAGQDDINTRKASLCSVLFGMGLFVSITAVGTVCTLLGRMMGDIPPLFGLPVGMLLVWLGFDLAGITKCRLPNRHLGASLLKGYSGAFILGVSFGILSGACTFGFIAPILAVITVQQSMLKGMSMMLCFAIGHCLPIIIAGSSVSLTQGILSSARLQATSRWGRKLAGVIVVSIGVYFIFVSLA